MIFEFANSRLCFEVSTMIGLAIGVVDPRTTEDGWSGWGLVLGPFCITMEWPDE